MASRLILKYDKIGDILYIQNCPPYAEQDSDDLGDRDQLGQGRQRVGVGGLGGIVVEALELGLHAVGDAGGDVLVGLRQADEAFGEERQRAATVGEDELHVAQPRGGTAEDEAG